jgi:O-antigen/teichoic acid export membrane protein
MQATPDNSRSSGVKKRLFWSFNAQFLSLAQRVAQQILLIPVLVTYWGTDRYADWIVILSAVNFLTICDFGLQIYFGNELLMTWTRGDEGAYRRTRAVAMGCYAVVLSIVATGFCASLYLWHWPLRLGLHEMDPGAALSVTVLLAISTLTTIPLGAVTSIYRAQGHYSRGTTINAIFDSLRGFGTCAVAFLGGSQLHAAILYISVALFSWFIVLVDQNRQYKESALHISLPSPHEFKTISQNALFYFIPILATPTFVNAPILIMGALQISPELIVGFTVCRTIIGLAKQIMQQISMAVGVEISREHTAKNEEITTKIFVHASRFSSGLAGMICGFIIIFAASAIAIWTRRQVYYDPSMMMTFIVTIILLTPSQISYMFFYFLNHPVILAAANGVQIAATFILCLLLIKYFSSLGAAIAVSAAEILSIGILIPRIACRRIGISVLYYCGLCLAIAAVSFAISATISVFLLKYIYRDNVLSLIIAATLWAACISPAAYYLLLTDGSRSWVRDNLDKRLRAVIDRIKG